ncbi:unnamed protein product [Blepharisma stoltei]|uniref:Ubiquitin-like domain-containing protein n=1 Tax=Blepharisma stoltei TaxID=1481888 RepID=A0AAU9IYJ2_9CILI|nr:unnamed protein product [Blepharisma stoltei]
MRITIEPERTLGIEAISVDPNYDDTIENVMCLISLKITTVSSSELELIYNGRLLPLSTTLDKQNIREGHTLQLKRRRTSCCTLL